MAASYLTSALQKSVLALIESVDRSSADFFAVAPFVIDCGDDAVAFKAAVSESQRNTIAEDYQSGALGYVSQLHRPGYDYARKQVGERFRQFDRAAIKRIEEFLYDWRRYAGKQPDQQSRSTSYQSAYGIDLILPDIGVRLAYDQSSLMGL